MAVSVIDSIHKSGRVDVCITEKDRLLGKHCGLRRASIQRSPYRSGEQYIRVALQWRARCVRYSRPRRPVLLRRKWISRKIQPSRTGLAAIQSLPIDRGTPDPKRSQLWKVDLAVSAEAGVNFLHRMDRRIAVLRIGRHAGRIANATGNECIELGTQRLNGVDDESHTPCHRVASDLQRIGDAAEIAFMPFGIQIAEQLLRTNDQLLRAEGRKRNHNGQSAC